MSSVEQVKFLLDCIGYSELLSDSEQREKFGWLEIEVQNKTEQNGGAGYIFTKMALFWQDENENGKEVEKLIEIDCGICQVHSWEQIISFSETVLCLCNREEFVPFLRFVDNPELYLLDNFDYYTRTWRMQIPPLATKEKKVA